MQRYRCKDCNSSWSENYGDSLRYTHLSEDTWKEMLRGFVEELSISKIAKNCDLSTKTVWLAKTKVNQAIMTMYGYTDLFRGNTQADEYYTRTAFKGKRDPEFFIYILRRMPRHHYPYSPAGVSEKVRLCLSRSFTPSSCSSFFICWEIADWETLHFSAA